MTSSNIYAKQYSNRRAIDEHEQYKLMLFPADNSIAVVKKKQCSPAEHDGFLHVQTGKRKFTGVVLEEGSFIQCSQAADRLTKKTINPEIESDYERICDESQTKQTSKSTSTISNLNQIPFENYPTTSNSTMTATTFTAIQSNDFQRGHSLFHNEPCRSKNQKMNTNTNDNANQMDTPGDGPLLESTNTIDSEKRHDKKKLNSKSNKRKHFDAEKDRNTTFDDFNNDETSGNKAHDDMCGSGERCVEENRSSTINTPTFAGHRVTSSSNGSTGQSNVSSMFQQLLGITSKIESQYLRPLLVAQERTETTIKCLLANQQKIQKALRKQKINISLTDLNESNTSNDDQSFLNSLEYTTSNGDTFDLLKRPGLKEHANRYVTSLIDCLYKPEELLALKAVDVPKDDKYLLIKEAVRNKFRLNRDEHETMWVWLHTVFLAKRRTLSAKTRRTTDAATDA